MQYESSGALFWFSEKVPNAKRKGDSDKTALAYI